jgi:ribonucleoside-diphosphate reductase beta chain
MEQQCSKTFSLCNLHSVQLENTCFLSLNGTPAVQRFDVVKHQSILKLNNQMLSVFWRPEEIDLSRDRNDFNALSDAQQKIFTQTLLRAVMLDSIQGRAPFEVLGPICGLSEVESGLIIQTAFENIHSQSYSHIIRNIYAHPDKIFDQLKDNPDIIKCASDISKYYDDVLRFNTLKDCTEYGIPTTEVYDLYEHKKAVWKLLISINGLEALRFHSAFAVFFAFAEVGSMIGNSKILSMIARDEQLHVAFTSQMLNIMPKEDPDYAKIQKECYQDMVSIYNSIADQEIEWVDYLFSNGVMLGLNRDILVDYIHSVARTRMIKFGVAASDIKYPVVKNPIPWMSNYLETSSVQTAPQESELINYTQGTIDNSNLNEFTFEF